MLVSWKVGSLGAGFECQKICPELSNASPLGVVKFLYICEILKIYKAFYKYSLDRNGTHLARAKTFSKHI